MFSNSRRQNGCWRSSQGWHIRLRRAHAGHIFLRLLPHTISGVRWPIWFLIHKISILSFSPRPHVLTPRSAYSSARPSIALHVWPYRRRDFHFVIAIPNTPKKHAIALHCCLTRCSGEEQPWRSLNSLLSSIQPRKRQDWVRLEIASGLRRTDSVYIQVTSPHPATLLLGFQHDVSCY